jgi:hypothetical protein
LPAEAFRSEAAAMMARVLAVRAKGRAGWSLDGLAIKYTKVLRVG